MVTPICAKRLHRHYIAGYWHYCIYHGFPPKGQFLPLNFAPDMRQDESSFDAPRLLGLVFRARACLVRLVWLVGQVSGEGTEEKYLIATSEQPLCAFHKGEWLKESELPLRRAITTRMVSTARQ